MAAHLAARTERVQALFPGALSADDFIGRAEAALCAYGFLGDNTLALTNLCRDESTVRAGGSSIASLSGVVLFCTRFVASSRRVSCGCGVAKAHRPLYRPRFCS